MKVKVINDTCIYFIGSVIIVDRILKNHYSGLWSSQFGTYRVKVLKKNCEIIENEKSI